MPITWTPENKFKLMLAIMQVKNPTPPDWNEVAKLLGPPATIEACKQQYKAIKKLAGKDMALDASSNTPQVTTPRKRKAKPIDKPNGANANADKAGGSNDDENLTSTPRKLKSVKVGGRSVDQR